jgi:adenosylhomocysteine nucleosidase
MKLLLVVPTSREARGLAAWRPLVVGAGETAGESLTARLISGERPDVVLIAGYCGALDPSLSAGAVILGRHAVAPDGGELLPDQGAVQLLRNELRRRRLRFVYSRILTLPASVATRPEKRDLWNVHGAAGADMETFHLAVAAEAAGVPWVAIRAVLDPASQSLPHSLRSWSSEADVARILRSAAMHPLEWPAYVRLAVQERRARLSLARTLRVAVPALDRYQPAEALPLVETGP